MEVTLTTAGLSGGTLRETMVCNAVTICAAATTGSIVVSGAAPCPPLPVNLTENNSAPAMTGPFATLNQPTGLSFHT
jgi:hypothetical protein